MTREMIEARKSHLQDTLQKMKAAAVQHQANLHGIEGAIADCDFWLSQLPSSPELNQDLTAVASTEDSVAASDSPVPSEQAA